MDFTNSQLKLIKTYIKVTKTIGSYPSRQEMKENGCTKDKIGYHFSSLSELKKAAKEYDPQAFNNLIDEDVFNETTLAKLNDEVQKYKRYVITSAVTGCDVHKGFYNAIKKYCEFHNACLLIIPVSEPTKVKTHNKWHLADMLDGHNIVFSDVALNNNLYINTIKIQAKMINPLTGLNRLTSEHGSCIIGSPKQELTFIPSSNAKLPKALMSTGAITKPDYTPEKYLSLRLAALGEKDHVIGALIVEIEDDEIFYFRQIQADKNGSFYDLDLQYTPELVNFNKAEYFIPGDWHCTETDPKVKRIWEAVTSVVAPEKIIIHDLFNGTSINHFDTNKPLTLGIKFNENKLSLEEELSKVALDLNFLDTYYEEIIIVKSNHDERLEKYLDSIKFITDPHNIKISLKLACAMMDGHSPLQWAMENLFKINNPSKFKWLRRDEDYKFKGIQLGSHGDFSSNGHKGTPSSVEVCCPNSVIGHYHSPKIIRNTWVTGTSTYLKLDYNNKGPSNWVQSGILIHKNGQRQLINVINGKWRL